MKKINIPVNREKKVLVVDDNMSITRLLRLTLEKSGRFVVRTVNDAMQAVETAREFKPDLMLLDVMMPDMGGHEIADKIKYDKDLMQTKIIFFSGLLKESETGSTGKVIGGNMCLAKSVKVNNVVHCIDKSFGESVVAH